jgi:hypothetical protein
MLPFAQRQAVVWLAKISPDSLRKRPSKRPLSQGMRKMGRLAEAQMLCRAKARTGASTHHDTNLSNSMRRIICAPHRGRP